MATDMWKRMLLRHSLFIFSRGIYTLFLNIYVWRQTEDLRLIALFSIASMVGHTLAFAYIARLIKRGYIQACMRAGLLGMSLALTSVLLLGESVVDYLLLIGFLFGTFNGMYWMSTHVESFDISKISNRSNFFAYRNSFTAIASILTPAVAWVGFSITDTVELGYQVVFSIGLVAMLTALFLAKVADNAPKNAWLGRKTRRITRSAKGFWPLAITNSVAPAVLKGGVASVLLPVLIFELLDGESAVGAVETVFQVFAIIAGLLFAKYAKGNAHMKKLIYLGGIPLAIGFFAMALNLSGLTYSIFLATLAISLAASGIPWSVLSTNFINHTPNYNQHKIEFILLLEYFRSIGFISSYVFILLAGSLSTDALRPILLILGACSAILVPVSLKLYKTVKDY